MPNVLHLFNIFGALTERAMLDYTLGLSRSGFDLTIAYESRAAEAPPPSLPEMQLSRIAVDPTSDVPAQMSHLAANAANPALANLLDQPFDLIHGHFGPRILQGAAWIKRDVPMIVSIYGYDAGRLLRDPVWIERYRWAAQHGVTFVALARFMEDLGRGWVVHRHGRDRREAGGESTPRAARCIRSEEDPKILQDPSFPHPSQQRAGKDQGTAILRVRQPSRSFPREVR